MLLQRRFVSKCLLVNTICTLVMGCTELPRIGVTITNAPASLGNCMPTRPGDGCP